ncbi:hypothetical protein LZK98_08280 [Sphingomonas cannabina]|uniref:hypothetical protein n=1 Tax=Sphingomonas cannabina TaxID=2899123 RepID=UPI001F17EC0E|nr:hypothetical protein [Sphingomonas cannabina]UIJ46926.1 hypothetical protein LZK98_08280 [Sphingomonas cannabina]
MMAVPTLTMSGFRPLYQTGICCPACGTANWIIGRSSAECGRCGSALPLAPRVLERRHD